MSQDAADLGVKPERALESILGGAEQPKEEEKMTPEKMYQEIMAQPNEYKDREYTYNGCSMWLAKQFLLILEKWEEIEVVGSYDLLYEKMKEINGEQDYDFTGFMVGWANNAARFALNKKAHANTAILERKGLRMKKVEELAKKLEDLFYSENRLPSFDEDKDYWISKAQSLSSAGLIRGEVDAKEIKDILELQAKIHGTFPDETKEAYGFIKTWRTLKPQLAKALKLAIERGEVFKK